MNQTRTTEKNKAVRQVLEQVNHVILGKSEEIKEIMTAFLADGHVLLEDIPGVGKTTLAVAFSKAMQLDYRRVQFTPDVFPSDLTGFSIYRREEEKFVYQEGSVFCNLLLADEINRTSPKTQSALLVPSPFLVIATQNPAGTTGTQYLPEAQVDRFMVCLSLGYPDYESELAMAKGIGPDEKYRMIQPVLTGGMLQDMQKEIYQVYMKDSVYEYLLNLVRATRDHSAVARGASPRATIALVKMAKAAAWMEGRDYVTPLDVSGQFPYVVSHRILLSGTAKMEKKTKKQIIDEIIKNTKIPPMGEGYR